MQYLNRFLIVLGLIFLLMVPCFSQSSKISLGLDYGSGVIQPMNVRPIITTGFADILAIQTVPKHIRGRLEFMLNPMILLRFSGGYGSTTDEQKFEAASDGFANKFETEVKTTGIPIEGTIFLQTPVEKEEVFKVRLGLVLGYYSYKTRLTGFIESLEGGTGVRRDIDEPDIKISGFAQSFMVGGSIQLSRKISVFFEFSKLGFSFLKLKQDFLNEDNQKIGEREEDYNAAPGLDDLGMTIGVSLAL
jgi:hypothetical protein